MADQIELPDDIMIMVCNLLPYDIHKIACVCKQWRLISREFLIKQYRETTNALEENRPQFSYTGASYTKNINELSNFNHEIQVANFWTGRYGSLSPDDMIIPGVLNIQIHIILMKETPRNTNYFAVIHFYMIDNQLCIKIEDHENNHPSICHVFHILNKQDWLNEINMDSVTIECAEQTVIANSSGLFIKNGSNQITSKTVKYEDICDRGRSLFKKIIDNSVINEDAKPSVAEFMTIMSRLFRKQRMYKLGEAIVNTA
jgi:hypothetical protein